MTEGEWLGCEDPRPMLKFLRGKASDRKLRLFAVACCQKISHVQTDERLVEALDVVVLYADGAATSAQRADAEEAADEVAWATGSSLREAAIHAVWTESSDGCDDPRLVALQDAACGVSGATASPVRAIDAADFAARSCGDGAEHHVQSNLIRDIFGILFRPVRINPAWQTPTVLSLATAAYEERIMPSGELDVARLAVLSDALEEVGCDDADILGHLRSPGTHVRGCWVLDLLLGKE